MKTKLGPTFPLVGNPKDWRRKTKKLIDTANPTTIQAVLVLLLEMDRQTQLKNLYKELNQCPR